MNKLVDKRVRINLYPFKQTAYLLEAFQVAALTQKWSDTDIELVSNQIKGLSLDEKFNILNAYCHRFADDNNSLSQEDVIFMLHFLNQHTHYLCTKDIGTWDTYDWSNFNSLRQKATRSVKRVFALFSDSVQEENKYNVETPPSIFYETMEEALDAVPAGQESITNIYALWIKQ